MYFAEVPVLITLFIKICCRQFLKMFKCIFYSKFKYSQPLESNVTSLDRSLWSFPLTPTRFKLVLLFSHMSLLLASIMEVTVHQYTTSLFPVAWRNLVCGLGRFPANPGSSEECKYRSTADKEPSKAPEHRQRAHHRHHAGERGGLV